MTYYRVPLVVDSVPAASAFDQLQQALLLPGAMHNVVFNCHMYACMQDTLWYFPYRPNTNKYDIFHIDQTPINMIFPGVVDAQLLAW